MTIQQFSYRFNIINRYKCLHFILEFAPPICYILVMLKNKRIMLLTALTLAVCFALASCAMPGSGGKTTFVSGEEYSEDVIPANEGGTVRVTFPEGFTVSQMAKRLEENGICKADEFRSEANKTEYLSEFGIEIGNPSERAFLLEGYLFPDTYDFYKGESVSSVIKKFLRNTMSRFTDEYKQRAAQLGYSMDEILNLAAIIQQESGGSAEAPRVSSVIHNRLDSPDFRRLQCDATVTYLKGSVKPYFDTDTYFNVYCENYNTYMCEGLPAGPINNPGLTSIKAALYPENTDYYYFLTDSAGVYHYSETYAEHQSKAVEAGLQ